jgi:hypothetical protein
MCPGAFPRWLAIGVVLAAIFAAGTSALAQTPAPGDGLSQQADACTTNVSYFRTRIDSVTTWSTVFMILGATVSAVGSACAGFLNSSAQRKVAAVIGALGAVVTVLPKALPDKQELQTKLTAAERQRVVGTKVRNQFQFVEASESITNAKKYVSARFTDCASLNPPETVPDIPNQLPVALAVENVPAPESFANVAKGSPTADPESVAKTTKPSPTSQTPKQPAKFAPAKPASFSGI